VTLVVLKLVLKLVLESVLVLVVVATAAAVSPHPQTDLGRWRACVHAPPTKKGVDTRTGL